MRVADKGTAFFAVAAVGLCSRLCGATGGFRRASASCDGPRGPCQLGNWEPLGWSARAAFNASQNETGWASLVVETRRGEDDGVAAYAAGYIEGALTVEMIWDSWRNFVATGLTPSPGVQAFVESQQAFVEGMLRSPENSQDATYWRHVGFAYSQLAGLGDGYNFAAEAAGLPRLNATQMVWLNMNVEFDDIIAKVNRSSRVDASALDAVSLAEYQRKTTHCSGLVKVTPELDDLLMMHATWWDYSWMLRIFKAYTLRYTSSSAETVLQSGFPGFLVSTDDFYTTSRNLAILETSNSIYNHSLFDLVEPNSVPYWARNTVANQLASSGREWHDLFYLWNSGTYNNQWVVVDYQLFEPGQPLKPWTLSVSESLPGPYTHGGEDLTTVLQFGHWPSYNVPYFSDIYSVSGYPEVVDKHGVDQSYQLAPRAKIFRRDAVNVNSLDDLQHFARLNRFGHDSSLHDAEDAIASRADLNPEHPTASGAIDAKAVNAELMGRLAVSAISGPTSESQPVFTYRGRWEAVPHFGAPERFDFGWQTFSAQSMRGAEDKTGTLRPAALVVAFL